MMMLNAASLVFCLAVALAEKHWIPETTKGMRCPGKSGTSKTCCTQEQPCGWMQGPCTSDDQCEGENLCAPEHNCLELNSNKCCYYPKPSSSGKVTPLSEMDIKALMIRVNKRIDEGECESVKTKGRLEGGRCEDDARHFFRVYERPVNGIMRRVMVSSGIPNYPAGQDTLSLHSPFRRCETWLFVVLPIDPPMTSGEGKRTGLDAVGNAFSGGHFFNDWSLPDRTLAAAAEASNLDGCFAHASPTRAYHHHANINCTYSPSTEGANDPYVCKHIGYYYDGVPVYGLCNGMISCYKVKAGKTEKPVKHTSGTIYVAGNSDDYEYDQAAYDSGRCTLDKANGAFHIPDLRYSYFMTWNYPFVPIWFMAEGGEQKTCKADC